MPDYPLPVDSEDISNLPRIRVTPALPVDLPIDPMTGNPIYTDSSQATVAPDWMQKLTGTGNVAADDRYITWPEKMLRSGLALPADVYEGRTPITDESGHTSQPVIERAQDMAGLAGMSSIPLAEKGALGAIGGKFYSTLENTIAGSKVSKATPEQWTSYLKNQPGVKPEELEFSLGGLPDRVLSKDELLAHTQENGIKLGEVVKGKYKPEKLDENKYFGELDANARHMYNDTYDSLTNSQQSHVREETLKAQAINPTKYSSYQLPGAENYRELLMTLPEKVNQDKVNHYIKQGYNKEDAIAEAKEVSNSYKSSHWDEPNVLAHIRMNDRDISGVGKTLHIEEIQSDWHQAGRKSGYKTNHTATYESMKNDLIKKYQVENYPQALKKATAEEKAAMDNITEKAIEEQENPSRDNLIPNAPFKKTWDELALKRVLSEAATKGYDAVSWTPGEAQAARYDLSKQVNAIDHIKNKDGTYDLIIKPKQGGQIEKLKLSEKDLEANVGKEIAEKIVKGEGAKSPASEMRMLSGLDLKVGGEGMKAFYDTMLPAKVNALIKKMGGKVEYENLKSAKVNELDKKLKENGYDPDSVDLQHILEDHGGRLPRWLSEAEANTIEAGEHGSFHGIENTKIPIIKITPQMREQISQKGFPLYSSGVPIFTLVEGSPFEKKKPTLTKVDYNPFTNNRAM